MLLADMNGDGFLDMVLRGIGGTGAQIFRGNGSGQFTSGPALLGPGLGSGVNLIADFNGDGIPDMALLGDNTVSFYPGLGSGTFGSEVGFGAGPSPSSIIPMNILRPTKPGFSDLAFPDPSGGVTVIYNVTR